MIYAAFLFLHGIVRWVVVLAGVNAIFRAWQGWKGQRPVEKAHRTSNIIFVASVHLNVLVGLMLYVALSPLTKGAFADMGAAMKNSALRFFVVEHVFGMVLVAILVTVGSVRAKKAPNAAVAHNRALIFFGIAFVVLMLSIPWPFYPWGRSILASWAF